jgi:acetoin utilization protein AcuB
MNKTAHCVRDYMTSAVITLAADSRLLDAVLLPRSTGKRHVPVIASGDKPVGIISDRDVLRLSPSVLSPLSAEKYNEVFESTPVTQVMTRDPVTIRPDTPMQDAVHIMSTRKISSLLVTDSDGKLVGIITSSDLLIFLQYLLRRQA